MAASESACMGASSTLVSYKGTPIQERGSLSGTDDTKFDDRAHKGLSMLSSGRKLCLQFEGGRTKKEKLRFKTPRNESIFSTI